MTTFANCSAAQAHSFRVTSCIPVSPYKQAYFATYRINDTRHIKTCQRSNSVHRRQKLHIVAARTESVDIPVGKAVPHFEVSLACRLHYHYYIKAT